MRKNIILLIGILTLVMISSTASATCTSDQSFDRLEWSLAGESGVVTLKVWWGVHDPCSQSDLKVNILVDDQIIGDNISATLGFWQLANAQTYFPAGATKTVTVIFTNAQDINTANNEKSLTATPSSEWYSSITNAYFTFDAIVTGAVSSLGFGWLSDIPITPIIILVVIVLIIWLWLRRRKKKKALFQRRTQYQTPGYTVRVPTQPVQPYTRDRYPPYD